MAKRQRNTKIGDIFVVQISDAYKRYFQYIVSDLEQLNSDVIRVFKETYPINVEPSLIEIVSGEVDFYAHTTTLAGVKLGLWKFYGNTAEIGNVEHILFRSSDDAGDPTIIISEEWWVWYVNQERKYVGKLNREYQKAYIGLIYAPKNIVKLLQGIYVNPYPKFK